MRKVIVIGPSGSGKSYFSKRLSELMNLPLYHLDNIWWKEDKTNITRSEFDSKLKEILKQDKWIIDGDYSRTYEVRMKECDAIFFLDFPLEVSLDGATSRIGKVRTDIPWTEDELDPEFKEWIINWYKTTYPITLELLNKYKDKNIIIFKSRKELNDYLDNNEVTIEKVEKDSIERGKLLEFINLSAWVEVKDHMMEVVKRWPFTDWEGMFVAKCEGRIVGMAMASKTDYYPLPEIYPWVTSIYVDESYRGRGIAGKLINHISDYLKNYGFNKSYIPSEYFGLYEKYGYKYLKDITNYGGGIDHLFVKEI